MREKSLCAFAPALVLQGSGILTWLRPRVIGELDGAAACGDEQSRDHALEAAHSAAEAISAACSTQVCLDFLQPRLWPPLRVRTATRSNCHAQGAAHLRHPLANPLIIDVRSKAVRLARGL